MSDEKGFIKMPDDYAKTIYRIVEGDLYPNTFEYLLKYGITSAIPEYDVFMGGRNKEEIYEECLKTGKRWEQILQKVPPGMIT